MKFALVNPSWTFERSIYFGCRQPHLPLELGSAKCLLEEDGHKVEIFDGHLFNLSHKQVADLIRAFKPDATVVTTAPTYLFWRCAPPELRVPQELLESLDGIGGYKIAVGPHISTSPVAAMRKLGVDIGVMGECEEVLVEIAAGRNNLPGTVVRDGDIIRVIGSVRATRFTDLPALAWPSEWIQRHNHHHHRFDTSPEGQGAETEASRGCPYHCIFCAKDNFRDSYRRRGLSQLTSEIDRLIEQGVRYLYFIDEIFLPNRALLEILSKRHLSFGMQTRIDLWKPEMIAALGRAGCVSIEAGIESITTEGRDLLDKECKLSTQELFDRLVFARKHVPFVQANLIETPKDETDKLQSFRESLIRNGVWANDPVPLFPYPGSPEYRRLWGVPDGRAWERALDYYLDRYGSLSDIQEQRPAPLSLLERAAC